MDVTQAAVETVRTALNEPNEWAVRMHALIESDGIDAALGQAYLDGMVFACEQASRHAIPAGDFACLCGQHVLPTLESTPA